jgi:hypothetical protein
MADGIACSSRAYRARQAEEAALTKAEVALEDELRRVKVEEALLLQQLAAAGGAQQGSAQ